MIRMSSRSIVVLLCVLSTVSLAACGGTGDVPADGRVIESEGSDGLTVTFASAPDPPAEGDNTIEVSVRGADGSPVTDATVTTVFSMPAMPSMNMPAMRSEATLAHESEGRYVGTRALEMGGTWNVAVTIARGQDAPITRHLTIVAQD